MRDLRHSKDFGRVRIQDIELKKLRLFARCMDWDAFRALVRHATTQHETLVAFIQCRIFYSGRAEAELDWGDRLLVLKQDNTVLIHQPENGNPINYIKPGGRVETERQDDMVVLTASHPGTHDVVRVDIRVIHDAMCMKLEDGKKQVLAGTERDMSNSIRDNPELIAPDFKPLSREEHTRYGFIDVFGHDGAGNLIVVECKRYAASLACVTQLRRYVERMKELKGTDKVQGVLASPSITANAQQMLEDWGFRWVRVEPPKRLLMNRDQKTLGDW